MTDSKPQTRRLLAAALGVCSGIVAAPILIAPASASVAPDAPMVSASKAVNVQTPSARTGRVTTDTVIRNLRVRVDQKRREIRANWKRPAGGKVKSYRVEVHRTSDTGTCLSGVLIKGRTIRYGPISRKLEYQVKVWAITANGQGPSTDSAVLKLQR